MWLRRSHCCCRHRRHCGREGHCQREVTRKDLDGGATCCSASPPPAVTRNENVNGDRTNAPTHLGGANHGTRLESLGAVEL